MNPHHIRFRAVWVVSSSKSTLRTIAASLVLLSGATASAETIQVDSAAALIAAINNADATQIVLAPGTYRVDQNISINRPGPATIRSAGDATIEFNALEGFKVNAPDWTFDNLTIRGVCANDSDCEHAFHIVGTADRTTLRNSRIINFNAQIKANGEGDPRQFPDDVTIELNEFYDEAPRQTSNPVTKIDVVGGRRWIIRNNYIGDFAKAQGNNISYGAFLKGNSRDGIFESNLVACAKNHNPHVRIGLSLGGGGTSPDSICEDQSCTPEHQGGIIRNNIILNCSDVGIYINKGANTQIFNNTLVQTSGIDIRFDTSSAIIANNVVEGRIRERDNGSISNAGNNIEQANGAALFQNPAAFDFAPADVTSLTDSGRAEDVVYDFCGKTRDAILDIGAIEYSAGTICDTTTAFHIPAAQNPNNMTGNNATNNATNNPTNNNNATNNTSGSGHGNDMGHGDMDGDGSGPDRDRAGEDEGCSHTPAKPSAIFVIFLAALVWRRRRCED